jgi:signal transduction histidine kinase/CheY-like chemotaxis protein
MRRPDGSELWLHHSQSALRDGDGRVVGAVGVLMDVTEQRLAREQLLQAHKMEAVGQLASGIAHDFNNLLVAILTCSEFLLESIDGSDPRRVDVEEIRHAGQRAALLVRRLLTFARKGPSTPTIVDLPAIVRGMEQLLRRTLGDHVELSFRLEPGLARIDPGHLEQVLLNLAVNARDAMPAGGRLHVETRTAPAEGHSAAGDGPAPDRQAVLTVADSGCGIPPEVLPRIFEPFFTTKGEGQGTGLGLSTVYGIVRQAGGRIAVDSAPGRGTTFRVCLPSAETAPAEAPSSPARANVRAAGGRRILLVEDDELVRRAARRMLEKAGHSVVEARCAVEALRRLEGPGIDLVLSDAIMPCRSGLALASQIASVHPALPVILMSGSPDPHRSAPGARPLLDKPFTAEALLSRIEEELRLAEAEPPRRGEPVSSGKPPR